MQSTAPDPIGMYHIITVTAFLAALGVLWLFVKRHQGHDIDRTPRKKRFSILESIALGPNSKAILLKIDNAEYMILDKRGAAPSAIKIKSKGSNI